MQEQAKEFDTEASGAASLLHSIFGIKRSGTGSSSQERTGEVDEKEQVASNAKSAARKGTPDAAVASSSMDVERVPAQSLLGSLFGWKGTSTSVKPMSEDVQPTAKQGKTAPTSLSTKGTMGTDTSEPEHSGMPFAGICQC